MSYGSGGSPFFSQRGSTIHHQPQPSSSAANPSSFRDSYQYASSSLLGGGLPSSSPSTDKKSDDLLLAETLQLNFAALNTSALVISQMSSQRSQIDRALSSAAAVKAITSRCQTMLEGMRRDARRRRRKLYAIITALAMLDAFIMYRLIVCGSLVCRNYN